MRLYKMKVFYNSQQISPVIEEHVIGHNGNHKENDHCLCAAFVSLSKLAILNSLENLEKFALDCKNLIKL